MVGPSLDDDERRIASRRLRIGFVLLVAVSGALVAYQTGASLAGVGVAAAASLALGGVLVYFLVRWFREFAPDTGGRNRSRRP